MVNYTVKRYFFEQSAVREFYSGAYYDLFLVMRGSGVFRCSEVVLPAQQQNLIIFKPGQGGRLEYAGAYGPLELIRVQLSPQTLARLSDADTDLEKSFNVVPFRQVAVRPARLSDKMANTTPLYRSRWQEYHPNSVYSCRRTPRRLSLIHI